MKRHLSMMRVNPFQKEQEDENSDLNHYNHDSQVIENCSSLGEKADEEKDDVEASQSSNGNQTPTLHASRGHTHESFENVPPLGLNTSVQDPIVFNSINGLQKVSTNDHKNFPQIFMQHQVFKSDLNPIPKV